MLELTVCPSCGSALLQALRTRTASGGAGVSVELRCPDCRAWMRATCTPAQARELDRHQHAGRQTLVASYERSVAESMESLAFCLQVALDRDLLCADDFRPRPRPG